MHSLQVTLLKKRLLIKIIDRILSVTFLWYNLASIFQKYRNTRNGRVFIQQVYLVNDDVKRDIVYFFTQSFPATCSGLTVFVLFKKKAENHPDKMVFGHIQRGCVNTVILRFT